ncbi:MAG: hypothetical protein CVU77_03045 [Elusimicrobia bacterium HGW-Elusimicrobia-1]|jgi:hypothetical protein|nr:MAG: hypothetical protein CVU77_03045 [Elusimicrobia bacterium HGW-Elusimicrobia-1]
MKRQVFKKPDLSKVKRIALDARPGKVATEFFAKPASSRMSDIIPDILAGKNIKCLAEAIRAARRKNKPVVLAYGAHLIKCGLSPLVISLIEKRWITACATNGAGIIHDFEIARSGRTSEEVADTIKDGSFGMVKDTGIFLNAAASMAAAEGYGLGETFGRAVLGSNFWHKKLSIAAACARKQMPFTVHAAIGTDIIYQHPECDGAAWGASSYTDFLKMISVVSSLGDGGVFMNFGSAVIIPEVFLKALSVARNLAGGAGKIDNFTTANFDMYRMYRPFQNIVSRPVAASESGAGYDFSGHHEIMLPLLYHLLTTK